jgi:Lipid A 3-O-deacylase (PagL)
MRSRSTIETVVCLLLGLALQSVAQTGSSFSGPQISSPFSALLDSRGPKTLDFDQASSLRFAAAPPTICGLADPDKNPLPDLRCFCSEVAELAPPHRSQRDPRSTTKQPPVGDGRDENSKPDAPLVAQPHEPRDRNLDIYYRNRREFSLDVGWQPVNIPFIYDFAVGDGYDMTPLKYTLVPIVASLRWHVTNVGWKWIFRGNMDFTFSGSITAIPRGPEPHYYSFDFGIRRNFVHRNWKIVPFFEQRGGAGIINAKEPLGVQFAQGQNLTFTYNLGVGARYNLNSKYSISAGMNYMHISNAYLSQPQFTNYGINVYGPMFGMDVRLGRPRGASQ